MRYELTQENIKAINDYIESGSTEVFNTDAIANLNMIYYALNKRILKDFQTTRDIKTRLQKRLDKINSTEEKKYEAGEFKDTGLDSVNIARALLYCLQNLKTYKLTIYKLIDIMYEMYASWLESKKERLFMEQPVATEWGPTLWRVKNKVNVTERMSLEDFSKVAEINSGVAQFIKNSAEKYYDYGSSTLQDYFLKSEPYRKASPEKNQGKKNIAIPDADIYEWKHAERKSSR